MKTNLHTSFSDFERFLRSQREEWQAKQKEVDEKFLELSSLSDELAAAPSVAKKRKRARNSNSCPQVQQDPFAPYAAELQVSFFKKVAHWFLLNIFLRMLIAYCLLLSTPVKKTKQNELSFCNTFLSTGLLVEIVYIKFCIIKFIAFLTHSLLRHPKSPPVDQ